MYTNIAYKLYDTCSTLIMKTQFKHSTNINNNNFNVKLKGPQQYIYLRVYSFKHLLNYCQISLIIKEFN
jgi:hypothetical protein